MEIVSALELEQVLILQNIQHLFRFLLEPFLLIALIVALLKSRKVGQINYGETECCGYMDTKTNYDEVHGHNLIDILISN